MATPNRGTLALQVEIQQLRERIAELERERAQNSPIVSKERLDLALEAAGLGTWEVASESGVVTASGRMSAMFGVENAGPRLRTGSPGCTLMIASELGAKFDTPSLARQNMKRSTASSGETGLSDGCSPKLSQFWMVKAILSAWWE